MNEDQARMKLSELGATSEQVDLLISLAEKCYKYQSRAKLSDWYNCIVAIAFLIGITGSIDYHQTMLPNECN